MSWPKPNREEPLAQHYVIVGDGAAGLTAAQHIRQSDPRGQITMYSEDPNAAYYRAALTNYLIGELREEQLWAVPPTFFSELNVKRKLDRVISIDPKQKLLRLSGAQLPVEYDRLLIATGSRSRLPDFPGAELQGVMTLRSMQDVRKVMDLVQTKQIKRAVIVGGGPLGLEWAAGLREHGCEVSLILRGRRFMENVLDAVGSDLLLARLRLSGVDVVLEDEIVEAQADASGRIKSIRTKNKKTIQCQLLGMAIGVICNTEFLEGSGVKLSKRKAVLVGDDMQTSLPGVYAAGDVAEWQGQLSQLWEPARHQGRVAGLNMADDPAVYAPGAPYMATRLYDLDFASTGDVSKSEGAEELVDFPKETGRLAYRRLLLRKNVLLAGVFLGERSEKVRAHGRLIRQLIDQQVDVSAIKDRLLDRQFNLRDWVLQAAGQGRTIQLSSPRAIKTNLHKTIALPKPAQQAAAQTSLVTEAFLRMPDRRKVPLKAKTLIGRAPENDVALADPSVSNLHAQVLVEGGSYFISDLDSTNGTFVNGMELEGPRMLLNGDRVQLGEVELTFDTKQPAQPVGRQEFKTIQLSSVYRFEPPAAVPQAGFLELDGRRIPLEKDQTLLGRDPQAEIVLEDSRASFRHAQITHFQKGFYLFDLGSTNGTWLDNELVSTPTPLLAGSVIRIGQTELQFGGGKASPPQAAEPAPQGASLSIREGRELGLTFSLDGKPFTVGRNPESNAHLDDASISWDHLRLSRKAETWLVHDLGSTNGTWVEGRRLEKEPVELTSGNELRLGNYTLLFQDGAPLALNAAATCPQCGQPTEAADKFCAHCGQSLAGPGRLPAVSRRKKPARQPRQDMRAFLQLADSAGAERVEIKGKLVVGRDPQSSQFTLADRSVSNQHFEIYARDGRFFLQDLGSQNGTYVNDQRVGQDAQALNNDDHIRLGRDTNLVFTLEDA